MTSIPRTCTINGCNNKHEARGWCQKHYARWKVHGNPNTTKLPRHNMSSFSEYNIWAKMLQRCHNPQDDSYAYYGGRGINVIERWHTFVNFYDDMGDRPSIHHSIDRIDNNRGYDPRNCRWATNKEQGNNRRSSKTLTYKGSAKTYQQWAETLGFGKHVISSRVRKGWSVEQVLTTPLNQIINRKN